MMEAKEFMAEDSLFVLLSAILALFMAVRAWSKGAMAPLWALLSWGVGGAAGYWMFNNGIALMQRYADLNVAGKTTLITQSFLAILTFSLISLLSKALLKHIFSKDSLFGNWMYGAGGAVLSLLPTAAILLGIALLIRLNGTIWEMNEVDKVAARANQWTERSYPPTVAPVRWRNSVENLPKGRFVLDLVDPISAVPQRNLAHLILASYQATLADGLREHYPTREIANHPAVIELLEDPGLNQTVAGAMEFEKYFGLLYHEKIRRTLRDYPDLREELAKIDMADEVRVIATGSRAEKRLPWLERVFS